MPAKLFASVVVTNGEGRVLLVREGDARVRGKYSLPGGHMEGDESPLECARRELAEEAGLDIEPAALLGVYCQGDGVLFAYAAYLPDGQRAAPGSDDILACEWLLPDDILRLPPDSVLRPAKLAAILADLRDGRSVPVDIVRDLPLEAWEQ